MMRANASIRQEYEVVIWPLQPNEALRARADGTRRWLPIVALPCYSGPVKRWVAALVAVLFLSTATLHVFAHHGESDDACAVCQVQVSSLPAVASPCVVVVRTLEFVSPRTPIPRALAACVSATSARAPPARAA